MPQRDGVMIVGWPRTGSTLVMGLVNALPDTHCVGEWHLPILPLARSVTRMRYWESQAVPAAQFGTRWPHYGIDSLNVNEYERDLARALRTQMLRSAPGPIHTLGAKENDWRDVKPQDLASLVATTKSVLGPDVLWICLDRSVTDASASWNADPTVMRRFAVAAWDVHTYLTGLEPTLALHYDQLSTTDPHELRENLIYLATAVLRRKPTEEEVDRMMEVANQEHSSVPTHATSIISQRAQNV